MQKGDLSDMVNQCVIGLDIGGTNTRIGAIALDGTLLHSRIASSKQIADGKPDCAIADLAKYINDYIDQHVPQEVLGIAVDFPATMDAQREVLYSASNLGENAKCRFDGQNIPRGLQKWFKAPVYMGKDSDFLLYNDIHELKIETQEMITGIYFGTGIGFSFVYRGETIYGNDGVAGEIGHLPISDNRRQCTCNEYQGCCETVASGWRLVQIRDEHFPNTPVPDLFVHHKNEPVLQTYVYDCARVIALTGNLLNSAYTVVGGGIPNMEAFPRDNLRENVLQMLRHPYPRDTFQLLFSPVGQNAGILGAAQFLFHKLGIKAENNEEAGL
jgi:allose kinase